MELGRCLLTWHDRSIAPGLEPQEPRSSYVPISHYPVTTISRNKHTGPFESHGIGVLFADKDIADRDGGIYRTINPTSIPPRADIGMAYRLQTCGFAAFRIQRTFELAQLWQVLDILAMIGVG